MAGLFGWIGTDPKKHAAGPTDCRARDRARERERKWCNPI